MYYSIHKKSNSIIVFNIDNNKKCFYEKQIS